MASRSDSIRGTSFCQQDLKISHEIAQSKIGPKPLYLTASRERSDINTTLSPNVKRNYICLKMLDQDS